MDSLSATRVSARWSYPLAVAVGLMLPSFGLAQGLPPDFLKFYPDFSDTADAPRNASGHVRDRQGAEAIADIYRRVIQQYGDKVAKLPKDDPTADPTGESVLYVDLRHPCLLPALAALLPDVRYLPRPGRCAGGTLVQARGRRAATVRCCVGMLEHAYCSSWGDDALELLGDLAFQDGRFDEALSLYRQLVPDREADRAGLVYPDPSVDSCA